MAGGNTRRREPDDDEKLAPLPWERQPGDSPQSWAAFVVYRDMGPARSIRAVCSDMGKDRGTIGLWSKRHGWRARVEEYDREMDRVKRLAMYDQAIRMGERHANEAMDIAKGLMVYPRALLKKLESDHTLIDSLSQEDAATLFAGVVQASKAWALISQAERVARGYSNEVPPMPTAQDEDMGGGMSQEDYVAQMGSVAQVLADAGKLPQQIADMLNDGKG